MELALAALKQKHDSEARFTSSKIAQLSKPKLGQKPLTPEQIAAQAEKLLQDQVARQAAEIDALSERFSAAVGMEGAGTDSNTEPPPSAAPGSSATAAASVAAPAATSLSVPVPAQPVAPLASKEVVPSSSGASAAAEEQGGGNLGTKSRAQKRQEKKAAERQRIDADRVEEDPALHPRNIEIATLQLQLTPLGLGIRKVPADGNCLFRAVSDQLHLLYGGDPAPGSTLAGPSHQELRHRTADAILSRALHFAPFLAFEPADAYPEGTNPPEDAVLAAVRRYCARLRTSPAAWGGQAEINALSSSLGVTVELYSADGARISFTPEGLEQRVVVDGEKRLAPGGRVRLSYHRHYYALGEHYNSVALRGVADLGSEEIQQRPN